MKQIAIYLDKLDGIAPLLIDYFGPNKIFFKNPYICQTSI